MTGLSKATGCRIFHSVGRELRTARRDLSDVSLAALMLLILSNPVGEAAWVWRGNLTIPNMLAQPSQWLA